MLKAEQQNTFFEKPAKQIQSFIPGYYDLNHVEKYRASVLIGSCIVIAIALVALMLSVMLLDLQAQIKTMIMVIAFTVTTCMIAIPFIYKNTGAHDLCANAVIFVAALAIFYTVLHAGGPTHSSASYFVVLPVLMAYSLMGIKWGAFWTIACLLVQWILIGMDLSGYTFTNIMSEKDAYIGRIVDWTLSFSVAVAIIVLYEFMNRRMQKTIDDEKAKYQYLALHDPLTGLPNRKLFSESLAASMSRAKRHEKKTALLLIDLDGFKPINDTHGHDAGDAILVHVAKQMNHIIRANDLAARLGGDEFAVILEDVSESDVPLLAEKLLSAIATPLNYQSKTLTVTGSIGISLYPGTAKEKDDFIKQADAAMYKTKASKNGWTLSH